MGRLDGKIALVTGASRGIGRAIAIALAKEGAAIAVNYCSSQGEAQRVVEELKSLGVKTMLAQANVSNGAEVRDMVQRVIAAWGRIDVMVNNAGITRDKSLRKMTDEDWFEVINTNLNSVYYGVMAVMPLMIEQKYGRIVNISSFVGQAGNFGQANYSASKGGIIAFTKTAAIELAKYNITVNALAPGFTLTDMLAKISGKRPGSDQGAHSHGPLRTTGGNCESSAVSCPGCRLLDGSAIYVNGGVYM